VYPSLSSWYPVDQQWDQIPGLKKILLQKFIVFDPVKVVYRPGTRKEAAAGYQNLMAFQASI
jgi:hypothetical protein